MKVLISSRSPPAEQDPESGIEIISDVEELLTRSDFVSIHCPLNDQTRHLIDAAALAKVRFPMKHLPRRGLEYALHRPEMI